MCNQWKRTEKVTGFPQEEHSKFLSSGAGGVVRAGWTYLISWNWHRASLASAKELRGSRVALMKGLTMAASRRTLNSKPSAETSVMYLLAPSMVSAIRLSRV